MSFVSGFEKIFWATRDCAEKRSGNDRLAYSIPDAALVRSGPPPKNCWDFRYSLLALSQRPYGSFMLIVGNLDAGRDYVVDKTA